LPFCHKVSLWYLPQDIDKTYNKGKKLDAGIGQDSSEVPAIHMKQHDLTITVGLFHSSALPGKIFVASTSEIR
jgi:hypothetical protein